MKNLFILPLIAVASMAPLPAQAQTQPSVETKSTVRSINGNQGKNAVSENRAARDENNPSRTQRDTTSNQNSSQSNSPRKTTKSSSKNLEETPKHFVNPVLNPIPVVETLAVETSNATYIPQNWETSSSLLFSPEWIWQHGGWAWDKRRVSWRLEDEAFKWKPKWTKPETYGVSPKISEKEDLIGDTITYVHYEDWLPKEKEYHCEAVIFFQSAIIRHRLALLPSERYSLKSLGLDVCDINYLK